MPILSYIIYCDIDLLYMQFFSILLLLTAQGIGIFLINKLSQLKKWSKDGKSSV
jgi:hypothetical protein